jgi:hypothetical protein
MNIPIFNGDMDMEIIMENTNQIYKQLIIQNAKMIKTIRKLLIN